MSLKTTTSQILAILTLTLPLLADVQVPVPPVSSAVPDLGDNVVSRDECSTTRVAASGAQIVEVATGLNYQDREGNWQPTQELIELTPDGRAEAVQGSLKVKFGPDLSSDTDPAITIITRSKQTFRTHPTAICFYDPSTGNSVPLATVNPKAIAELLPPNQIVWRNAFDSDKVKADVRVTYTRAGLETDVIFTSQPKTPESFSLNSETAQIQLLHNWIGVSAPEKTELVTSGELSDEMFHLGDLWFPTGSASLSQPESPRDEYTAAQMRSLVSISTKESVPIQKRWQSGQTSSVLAELINWRDLAPSLSKLPLLSAVRSRTSDIPTPTRSPQKVIELASLPYPRSGVICDLITVQGSASFTFNSGVTYYVPSTCYFAGTVTFNQDAVIKYYQGTSIVITGASYCYGTLTHPTVLTSWNEDLYGEWIKGSLNYLVKDASVALHFYYPSQGFTFSGFRIRGAQTAIRVDDSQHTCYVSDCLFEWCDVGLAGTTTLTTYIQTSKKCSVTTEKTASNCYGSMTDVCSGDSDGNNIPDSWEYYFFGNLIGATGAAADYDGDGKSNLNESPNVAGWWQCRPQERPAFSTPPPYQVVQVGGTANFTASMASLICGVGDPNSYNYTYEWFKNGAHYASTRNISIANVQLSDSAQYELKVTAPCPWYSLYTNFVTRLVVCDSYDWSRWTEHIARTNGKTELVWSTRLHPTKASAPTSVQWDHNGLLWGQTGLTAISACNSFETVLGQNPVTALTPRHGFSAGHPFVSYGSNIEMTDKIGQTVWFVGTDNTIYPATIAKAWARYDSTGDYSLFVFNANLPAAIQPLRVMARRSTYSVLYRVCQHGKVSANQPPFVADTAWGLLDDAIPYFNHDTYVGGDSGSPNMLILGSELIFNGGTSASAPSTGTGSMQERMNTLSSDVGCFAYQMQWY